MTGWLRCMVMVHWLTVKSELSNIRLLGVWVWRFGFAP